MFRAKQLLSISFLFLLCHSSTTTTQPSYATYEPELDLGTTESVEEEMYQCGRSERGRCVGWWPLHMDIAPVGHLPDNVYRELAWYGIQQTQPLYRSSKYKAVARLIHQHTLGRPNVILDSPPQGSPLKDKQSRGIIAEEAAKWSKGQRSTQEFLLEIIKTGGNGITVRTVWSANKKTTYMIHESKYYKCPDGSEPDLDSFREQANIHFNNCTRGKSPILVPIDPCIEAESAPIEYSFTEGWMFCFGNGDRENIYFQNGTLDCGNKTKMSIEKFERMCAIDNNVVIWYEYYGDEPRKDLIMNSTICMSYDPCKFSYLYRLEPPPRELEPSFPETTPNPCDSTVCDECIVGATEDEGTVIEIPSDDERRK